jgi:hypothetical protein
VGADFRPMEAGGGQPPCTVADATELETLVVSSHLMEGTPVEPQTKLVVKATMRFSDGLELEVMALVDTGAEVCIVRKDLVPPSILSQVQSGDSFLPLMLGSWTGAGRRPLVI